MAKTLVIAEKPSAGADMAKVLHCDQKKPGYLEGDEYIVTWAVGHLVGLKYPEEHDEKYKTWRLEDLPFSFPLSGSLKVLQDTKSQFAVIRQLIQRPDISGIINAGDAGREGYLIQEWIYRLAGNQKPKRVLWASSLTEEALKKAFSHLKDPADFRLLLEEAEARAIGDYNMGINYSRALTLTIGKGKVMLKYGRCQTPLLNMIVQRDAEIEAFHSRSYYNIEITYQEGFKGILLEDERHIADIFDQDVVREYVKKLQHPDPAVVILYKCEEKKRTAPTLYNLAELQKCMGRLYGYTPEETLSIAQSLYEKYKILSYPRTDSRALSMDVFREIKEHIRSCGFGKYKNIVSAILGKEILPDKKYFNDHKVTDHHALIPTIHPDMEGAMRRMSEAEQRVFAAVLQSFLAIFFPPYEHMVTEIVTEKNGLLFSTRGITVKKIGYKAMFQMEEKEDDEEKILPKLQYGQKLPVTDIKRLDKKTKPPMRYTVSSIITVMEQNGVGTSATRAEIIKKLMDNRAPYIRLDGGKYFSTALGRQYISAIPDVLKDIHLTQKFESSLQKISAGQLTKEEFIQQIYDEELAILDYLKECNITVAEPEPSDDQAVRCPKCGKPMRENDKAYSCTGYKEGCDFKIWKTIAGKKITQTMAGQLLTKGKTGKIKGFKKSAGGTFDAYLILKLDGSIGFSFK